MVRLDTTEVIDMNKMIQENADKKVKTLNSKMLVDCPELNFLTDQVLSGTMLQVGKDI